MLRFLRNRLSPSRFKRMFVAQAAVMLLFVAANGWMAWRSFNTYDSGVIDQDLKLLAEAMARMAAMRPDAEGARRAGEEVEEMNRSRSDPPIRREEFAYPSQQRLVNAMCVGAATSCRAINISGFLALPTLVEHDLMRHRSRTSRRNAPVRPSRSTSRRCRAPAIAIASRDSTTCAAVSSLGACPTPALYSASFARPACRAGRCRTNLNGC